MKVLFLSHKPHEVHLEFAKSVDARVKIIHMNGFIKITKKIFLLNYLYPVISLFYSFFIKVKEDFILVDGGSSLYMAAFLKIRYPSLKIIFLDGDLFFYRLKSGILSHFFYDKIDAIISVSKQNEQKARMNTNVPIRVVSPYPKKFKRIKIQRKNYGLYVGRLDPDKNIKRIIEFGLQCPYLEKFIVIGDGTYTNYVKRSSLFNKKLIYLGSRNDLGKFYSECKFLIHLPDYDPHPCTTMEAASCGCFPIVSAGTGTKYLFDKRFIIENPNDFESINDRIRYFLDNEKTSRRLLSKAIRKFPNKKSSIDLFKKSFYQLAMEVK